MEAEAGVPDRVWKLMHYNLRNDEREDGSDALKLSGKALGTFSSQGRAVQAILRFLPREGFRDYPQGFVVEVFPVGGDAWEHGPEVMRWTVAGRLVADRRRGPGAAGPAGGGWP